MISNRIYRLTLLFYGISPLANILLILIAVVIWTFINMKSSGKVSKWINSIGLCASSFAVVLLGLINRVVKDRSFYLIPFQRLFSLNDSHLFQIILNTMFFVPIGLTLPYVINEKVRRPIRTTIIFGFLLSLTVELLQLFLHRGTFETEDIITNTLGTAIGTLSFFVYNRLRKGSDKNDSK